MLKQLKEIYPSLIIYNPNEISLSNDYKWFITRENEIIGIKQTELTEKDERLLSTFFEEYNITLPKKTPEEIKWSNYIDGKQTATAKTPYRFIYFSIQKENIKPTTFKEAMDTLFDKTIPILWENETEGIIIEEIGPTDEEINYEQIINIIMTDLYISIKFFIGETKENYTGIGSYYKNVVQYGNTIFQISKKDVIRYIEAIPYIILDKLSFETKEMLLDSVLKNFRNDHEMLKTIETFLHYNLNVSETAKQLYMHRNSLQYRIDKFINETGINIQQFNEALTVKLALLIQQQLD